MKVPPFAVLTCGSVFDTKQPIKPGRETRVEIYLADSRAIAIFSVGANGSELRKK